MTPLEPTPASEWGGPVHETLKLPSGKTATLREKFPVYLMLRTGQFSQDQFTAFQAWQDGEPVDPDVLGEVVELMICTMFVEPRVSTDGADGTVHINSLAEDDVDYVMTRANGGALDPGFHEQPGGADDRSDRASVRKPAKRAARAAKRKPSRARD